MIYKFECSHCKKPFTDSKHKRRVFCSRSCRNTVHANNPLTRAKINKSNTGKMTPRKLAQLKRLHSKMKGANNPNWKGGSNNRLNTIRTSAKYKKWRLAVYERDKYTCQTCGQVGGKLNADHIKKFSIYPNLRFDLNNGRTLCIPCHRKTDTWGFRYNFESYERS